MSQGVFLSISVHESFHEKVFHVKVHETFTIYRPSWTPWLNKVTIKYSVQFSHSVMSNSFRPHEQQHTRPPCPSPTPRVYPNSSPLSQCGHLTISSSVAPFSSCPQSFPASESFQMSQLFGGGGQSIAVSASTSVFPMNTQDWSALGWTGWISLQSKGLSRVFSNRQFKTNSSYRLVTVTTWSPKKSRCLKKIYFPYLQMRRRRHHKRFVQHETIHGLNWTISCMPVCFFFAIPAWLVLL